MQTENILSFLKMLSEYNSYEWMKENKPLYKEAMSGFQNLVHELTCRLAQRDPSVAGLEAKNLIFKLNRDTRFSHDKSPYNPAFRAHISSGGRIPIPAGYYLHIAPGAMFLGGGIFAAVFKDATDMIRSYISLHGEEFSAILSEAEFKKNFILKGERLKNIPAGYDKEHPMAEYLKHKSWDVEYHISDELFLDYKKFMDTAVRMFLCMRSLNEFLNKAAANFKMPERK